MAWLRSWVYWPPAGGPGRQLLAPALVLAGVLVLLGVLLVAREYRADRQAIIEATREEAASAAFQADRIVERRLSLLHVIASGPAFRRSDIAASREFLSTVNAQEAGFSGGIVYLDADGAVRASTSLPGSLEPPADLSDRPFVRVPLETGAPYVGAAFVGDFCPPVLPIAAPVRDADGGVSGLIVGWMLLEPASSPDLLFTPGVPAVVVDRAGQMIVHDGVAMAPVDVSSDGLLRELRAAGSGVRVGIDGLLGRSDRLVGFAESPVAGWMIVVTRPTSEAFAAPLRRSVLMVGALLAAVTLALSIAWSTARNLDRIAEGEHRLRDAEHAARETAEEALRTREEAIGAVSHDLRSPLTGIAGFAGYLRRRSEGTTVDIALVHDAATEIEKAAYEMNAMLVDLLDAARLQAGRDLVLDRAYGNLQELLHEVVEEEQRRTALHEIHLFTAERLEGEWDAPRLRRVFGNLLSNAVKFSPAGGEIRVTAGIEDDGQGETAVVAVHDQGIGIPAEELPHVFERFWRSRNAASITGSGVGLAGARHIVELHGGAISVESREHEGSTFFVRLPLTGAARESEALMPSGAFSASR